MTATMHEMRFEIVRLPGARSDLPLRDLIEFASSQIDKRFKNTGRILPMWHAETATETLIIVGPLSKDSKDATVAALAEIFREEKVLRYLFIDEAWMVTKPQESGGFTPAEVERMRKHGVSERPDRQEVIMINAEDKDIAMVGMRDIIRPAKGKARLGPLQVDTSHEMQSRWFGLLAYLKPTGGMH